MDFLRNLFKREKTVADYKRDLDVLSQGLMRLSDANLNLSAKEVTKIAERMAEKWKSLEESYGERGRNYQRTFIGNCADFLDSLYTMRTNPVQLAENGTIKFKDPAKVFKIYTNLMSFLALLHFEGRYPEVEELWDREKARAEK